VTNEVQFERRVVENLTDEALKTPDIADDEEELELKEPVG
jgi:hypothetical protein